MGAESFLERERRIRRKVESVFNKQEADFDSREEYDNYLEEREDIAFNLIEGIDVAATNAKLAKYERDNADVITAVAARQAEARRLEATRNVVDEEASSSLTGASGAGVMGEEEGHPSVRYATAGPSAMDARPAPALVPEPPTARHAYPAQDPILSEKQRHALMAKASGWDPGIVTRRALEQAFTSIF